MEPFKYRIVVGWSDDDEAFVARIPALAGCVAHGSTEADAVMEARAAGELMLSVAREHGDRLPPPDASAASYSGNLRLRLPRSLHARLDSLAAAEGVSLNQLMVSILAEGAGARGERYRIPPPGSDDVYGVAESPGEGMPVRRRDGRSRQLPEE